MSALDEYFAALERLKKGTSKIVPKGTRITNDAVALEAGRGKGSIKKSRLIFADLIAAIDQAAEAQQSPEREQKERYAKAKTQADRYRSELDAALAREVSLLREVLALKKELNRLTGKKILPLRKP